MLNDAPEAPRPSTYQKALELNLDESFYGTIAEIGAGQGVAQWLFQVGAASGTIAKSMSAYDMTFSDQVYGPAKRYVSRERLTAMLAHEYDILIERLGATRGRHSQFFAFANTVRARGYNDDGECHGWMGIRFQGRPGSPANEILIHARMLDSTNVKQQEALGIIGINIIYATFCFRDDLPSFAASLLDDLGRERIEVDVLRFDGADFATVDNRLCALQLVESGLTDAALIDQSGEVLQPAEIFYKRPVLVQRGAFNPVTRVNLEMMRSALIRFQDLLDGDDLPHVEVMEVTMHNLLSQSGTVEQRDFLQRADALQSVGKTVLVSKFSHFHQLGSYYGRYTRRPVGIVLGVSLLEALFDERWYEDLDGGILESFGRLFRHQIRLFVYPAFDERTGTLRPAHEARIPAHLQHLFHHLFDNGLLIPVVGCENDDIRFTSRKVRRMIDSGDARWKALVPEDVLPIYG